jgi:transposase-like protein
LEDRLPKGAALMMGAKEEVLAFTAFPSEHWRQIWSTVKAATFAAAVTTIRPRRV